MPKNPQYEPCPRCGGAGRVEKPRWMVPMESAKEACLKDGAPLVGGAEIPSNAVYGFVLGSASIFEACDAAKALAVDAGAPCVFEFNDHTVIVRPDADAPMVARAWWDAAFKETPEQTLSRR